MGRSSFRVGAVHIPVARLIAAFGAPLLELVTEPRSIASRSVFFYFYGT
jgi:hypothetical protein